MAQSLYTPFMKEGVTGVREALADRRTREAASKAYMGDAEALQDLAMVDPEMAIKVEEQAAQRKTRAQQAELNEAALEAKRRKFATENAGLMSNMMQKIGQAPDYETAAAFADERVAQLKEIMGEENVPLESLTEEQYEQAKAMYQAMQQRETKVVDGNLVDAQTGEVVFTAPADSSSVETLLVDTPDGQILVNKATGEEIKTFQPKPPKEKDPTGEERKAVGFLSRMQNAETELADIAQKYPDFDPVSMWETTKAQSNVTMSKEMQQYRQAAKDWIRAKLRKESGAVIGEQEMADEYSTYFPVYGDSAEVIEQKARSRKEAERQMEIAGGRAMKELEGGGTEGASALGELGDDQLDAMIEAMEADAAAQGG